MLGAMRSGICLTLEHPLESIKVQWQSQFQIKGINNVVNYIYQEKGLTGFYRGFTPNLIRVIIKQLYRWPMMIYFPQFYNKNLSHSIIEKFEGLPKILSGIYPKFYLNRIIYCEY